MKDDNFWWKEESLTFVLRQWLSPWWKKDMSKITKAKNDMSILDNSFFGMPF